MIQETMDMLYDDEIANKNKKINKIYFLTGGLIVLSLAIDFFGNFFFKKNMLMYKHY